MKRRASALLIGSFVVAGFALLALAIIALAGGGWLVRKERAVMHFGGSLYGLQVGAPVVFRGVRVGSVSSIEVRYDAASDRFFTPVEAELERGAIQGFGDGSKGRASGSAAALPVLVQRGLEARLATQSLITGLLYVDLDLRPDAAGERGGTVQAAAKPLPHDDGVVEVPTGDTTIQHLKNQLDSIDVRKLADDLAAIAGSARQLATGPQLQQALEDLREITGSVKRGSMLLERRIGPLADAAERALAQARDAGARVGTAAAGIDRTAASLGRAGDRASALLAADSPLIADLRKAAAELARSGSAISAAAGADSGLRRDAERALQDVSRAARALRELADTLERNPEALLRGRPEARAR